MNAPRHPAADPGYWPTADSSRRLDPSGATSDDRPDGRTRRPSGPRADHPAPPDRAPTHRAGSPPPTATATGHTNAPGGRSRPPGAVPAPRLDPPDPSPAGDDRLAVTVEVRLIPADQAPELAAEQLAAITEVLAWLSTHYPPA